MTTLMHNMIGAVRRTVAPTIYPVSRDEVKEEIGGGGTFDDNEINGYLDRLIKRAVAQVELDSRRAIMTQTWQANWDRFPCDGLELPWCPVASVTFLKYYTGGVLTTWNASNYQTDLVSDPARIQPVSGAYWPATDSNKLNAVQVEWVAGYASQSAVPDEVKDAVLRAVWMKYNRCDSDEAYQGLITRLRRRGFI